MNLPQDITTGIVALAGVVLAGLASALPFLIKDIFNLMALHIQQKRQDILTNMAKEAAGSMYVTNAVAAQNGTPTQLSANNYEAAAVRIATAAPQLLTQLGVTPTQVAERVKSAMGDNMVQDPTIGIGVQPVSVLQPVNGGPTMLTGSTSDLVTPKAFGSLLAALCLSLALGLGACTSEGGKASPGVTLLQIEQGIITADKVATSYIQVSRTMPLCSATVKQPCQDLVLINMLKARGQNAHDVFKKAQASPADMQLLVAAQAALTAYQDDQKSIPPTPVGSVK